jgi:hypothetical protein
VRTIIARLVLLVAVLLMPLGMTPAAANGGGDRMAAGMIMGHCDGQRTTHHPKAGFAECTMACAAALPAIGTRSVDDPPPIARTLIRPLAAAVLRGLHPDTATPPPKAS